jgi:hypothetical protein
MKKYMTPSMTPWCRILFENMIFTQLVKKIMLSLCNPKVRYRVHKSPPLDPILSQPNPVRLIYPYLPKVHHNVILPPTPRSSQWSLTFGPSPANNSPTMRATCPAHLALLDLITLTTFGKEYRPWSSLLCNFLHDQPSSLLGSNLLNTVFVFSVSDIKMQTKLRQFHG